jgi:hypothetical protein
MAGAFDSTSKCADLPYSFGSSGTTEQVRSALASRSLAGAALSHGHAVGALEPGKYFQFNPAAADRDRICQAGSCR